MSAMSPAEAIFFAALERAPSDRAEGDHLEGLRLLSVARRGLRPGPLAAPARGMR